MAPGLQDIEQGLVVGFEQDRDTLQEPFVRLAQIHQRPKDSMTGMRCQDVHRQGAPAVYDMLRRTADELVRDLSYGLVGHRNHQDIPIP